MKKRQRIQTLSGKHFTKQRTVVKVMQWAKHEKILNLGNNSSDTLCHLS